MSTSIPEAQIRKAVDDVFLKYDINNDSRLENFEIMNLFQDTLVYLGK